ncbi:PA14 domain-containing protein [Pseudobacter ginsenosidimutans]|uniref:Putative secreted protein (Por secretion system target) n=1 Tax=Pseudobacter ginsenosidimutans TaxID=661488 RepID=A0A4Q7MFU7_9BACT|nr:PA14 domain-containing protein [Pseudobacter ginsenosidimutans]QEC45432.1 T9SS type A sorting domain-containing protein [Pseudobacter ginsenosidimutans]RZS66961.1 putative secreted protein (Por secretion system target) [Pseudobacter ginsenosidimutans]
MKSKLLLVFISGLMLYAVMPASAQTCARPTESQTAYYTAQNYWYAYFYRNTNFTDYHGRVRYGAAGSPNFNTNINSNNYNPGGGVSTFNCALNSDDFSVRAYMYRTQATAATYTFTVSTEGGVRLYIDGNLVIDEWYEQDYTSYDITYRLSAGTHTFVLEYYESADDARFAFTIANASCTNTPAAPTYGTNNRWNAYFYDGKNFETHRRSTTNAYGTTASPTFNTTFGGNEATLSGGTNNCNLLTETFSARLMLTQYFPAGYYLFTVGGDDGFRLSLDGGATWVIDRWVDQVYTIATQVVRITTAGNRNMVLEFYENHGDNQLSFDYGVTLPVSIIKFDGTQSNGDSRLSWQTTPESTEDRFVVERSTNGRNFDAVGEVKASAAVAAPNGNRQYQFTDRNAPVGSSWYRLKIIDRNGPEKYSSIVSINTKAQAITKIYPTLIDQTKQLFIQTDRSTANLEIVIRNISGQAVLVKKLGQMARGQIATLPLQDAPLSKGSYVVQVLTDGAILHKQMIIVP